LTFLKERVWEVLDIGEAENKLLQAWKESTGKERLNFIIKICSRYRALVKKIIEKVELRLEEKV
jgi:hypothetical protein